MSDSEAEQLLPEGEPLRVNEWEAALTLVIGGILFLIGVVGVFSGHGEYHHAPGWLGPILGLICLGGGIYLGAKCRSGLIVTQDGVIVQGAIRRRHLRWHEVEHFELTTAIYVPVLRIDLAGGEHVRTPGFKARSRNERELATKRVAELNRRAADASSGDRLDI